MAKIIIALSSGILIGIFGVLTVDRFVPSSDPTPGEVVRDIQDVPTMPKAVAEKHRQKQYTELSSVQEILALPTEFARSEAMYVLAGRADSAGIQNLIFEANRIADEVERVILLKILFFRLAETDPESALALARIDLFDGVKSIEQVVWYSWARMDLDDALFFAKTQSSASQQNSAAQNLFAAFGYLGNETTDRIESELGIGPDQSTRARYLYRLADESPAEAITFINGLPRDSIQQQYVSWLAYYLSTGDSTAALRHEQLFSDATDGKLYGDILRRDLAQENPRTTIDRILASGGNTRSNRELHSAFSALADDDVEAAKHYFEQDIGDDNRRTLGSAIASKLAETDPDEALAWSRANDSGQFPYFQMAVLQRIAQTDPQHALTEALKEPNSQTRSNLLSNVLNQVAREDPQAAVAALSQIPNEQNRQRASEQLVSTWIRYDPESAIDWVLSQDKESAQRMIQQAGSRLLRNDIDAAIRLLPRIDEQSQVHMRQQIAQQLATSRSPTQAQDFIRQFEGQSGYAQLQASLISGVAQTDVLMAKQLADQLSDSSARDSAYVQIIGQRAQTDPVEAARWVNNVSDDQMRGAATGQLVASWYGNDPVAATRWATNLPSGPSRDSAIMQMSYQWRTATADQTALIASIEDRDMRGQAKVRQIYNLIQTDPAKARELLKDEDIPSYLRQQVETRFSRYVMRY